MERVGGQVVRCVRVMQVGKTWWVGIVGWHGAASLLWWRVRPAAVAHRAVVAAAHDRGGGK